MWQWTSLIRMTISNTFLFCSHFLIGMDTQNRQVHLFAVCWWDHEKWLDGKEDERTPNFCSGAKDLEGLTHSVDLSWTASRGILGVCLGLRLEPTWQTTLACALTIAINLQIPLQGLDLQLQSSHVTEVDNHKKLLRLLLELLDVMGRGYFSFSNNGTQFNLCLNLIRLFNWNWEGSGPVIQSSWWLTCTYENLYKEDQTSSPKLPALTSCLLQHSNLQTSPTLWVQPAVHSKYQAPILIS